MFANFNKAFTEKTTKVVAPKEILDFLSKDLPDGFRYVNLDNGACGINADDITITLNMYIPVEIEKHSKNIKSMQDYVNYLYRTQQTATIIPIDEEHITINDIKFKINDLILFPFEDKRMERITEYKIIPEKFPEPFIVPFVSGGITKNLLMERKPYDSMTEILYKSINENCVEISYILNEENANLSMNIHVNFDRARTVQELLDAFKFFNGFVDGGLQIRDHLLGQKPNEDIEKINPETVKLWEKILAIETVLGVKFNPSNTIKRKDAYLVEGLYITLVENKPIKEYVKMDTLNGKGLKFSKDNEEIIGKELMFIYIENNEYELLDENIKLSSVVAIYNIKVINIITDKENDEYIIELEPTGDKGTYRSILYFKIYEDAKEFHKENISNHEMFQNAKEIILD